MLCRRGLELKTIDQTIYGDTIYGDTIDTSILDHTTMDTMDTPSTMKTKMKSMLTLEFLFISNGSRLTIYNLQTLEFETSVEFGSKS